MDGKVIEECNAILAGGSKLFEEVLAALAARDNLHPPDIKNLIKAEFLHGAAAAFAACWRGEESERCLAEALALYDLTSPFSA